MGKFTITNEINCNEETFWKIFFDKEFNEKLYRGHLGFPDFRILEQRDSDTETIRKVAGTPKMSVPGPVAKVLGSNFSYTEEGRFDKKSKVWSWKMTPGTMADKLRNEGVMRIERIGDSKVRRIAEIVIEAKVFGIGGLIESSAEKQLREGWDGSAVYMNDWVKTHS
ncbi:DUF2505 domain-containing protein [Polyangium jinanense]|uniref:DUF2505 domain-containing protein n=1 Tax=Polyangium jinanense TaxID=2829994 RepID=A0A9X3X9L3_9BACT|nr:DUF2505 domain-containing protein [Polyangium jinanense]MDC3960855.1 DUF2505 domain-containing protein [Polyangium jinanense]MDC3984678.1 DUF2505 domain-containing protein [Polyangium jinanense]